MQQGAFPSLQLIDQHKTFIPQALTKVLEPLKNCNKDYFTVAIIGSQNTGKSTLLNHLFKTHFKVLEGLAGCRTTRGIILGRDYATNLVVMDVEGNDSYENHLEGDENYEKMVSSFALVAANLLIVNIHEKQLGQHTGSQYETLSIVLRICIDQFKQQSPKTVLFCLRDANPQITDEGECRRKLQNDMQKIWKNVWAGTKKAAEFEKYQSSPDKFFTLEVAFLRQYDRDYPEDFIEDVAKLRERFVNPQHESYLFKRQKKEFNVPANDLPLLLSNIWSTLTSNKELNLPNQKIQLANYRCEEIYYEIEKKFQKQLQEGSKEVKNYGQFLNRIAQEFKQRTARYTKTVSEKWQNDIMTNFRPKINKVVLEILQNQEHILEEQYANQIKENIFFNEDKTFIEEAKKLSDRIIEKYISILKELGYLIENRKERIDKLSNKLDSHIEDEKKDKISHIEEEFNREGQRNMCMLAATVMNEHFGLEFWPSAYTSYRAQVNQLITVLSTQLLWARGEVTSSNELDEHEDKLYNWLVNQLKSEFEKSLSERLVGYFKKHFQNDQYDTPYNFNALDEHKISALYSQTKQMAIKLLQTLNDFKFNVTKRSSFICDSDFNGKEVTPFLQANKMLSIKQSFERKANDQFYTVIRRKKESESKRVPWYLILVIIFFVYDDLPSPQGWLFKLLAIVLVLAAIPFAFGQGHIVTQVLNSGSEAISKKVSSLMKKRSQSQS